MTLRRYCPVCKHTTKHEFDPKTGDARCLSKTHYAKVKK